MIKSKRANFCGVWIYTATSIEEARCCKYFVEDTGVSRDWFGGTAESVGCKYLKPLCKCDWR
jgi:hypothetical protein